MPAEERIYSTMYETVGKDKRKLKGASEDASFLQVNTGNLPLFRTCSLICLPRRSTFDYLERALKEE